MQTRRRVRFSIYGRVQGVGYRYAAVDAANRLNLGGWIRNHPTRDDLVEGEVEGSPQAVEQFLAWARQGPMLARVLRVTVEEVPPVGDQSFAVRR